MVLAFTEEQKKEISARGMTVIQTKLVFHRFAKAIKPVLDMCKNMSKEQIEEFLKSDEEEI